ncbi:MAG: 16S rRNA (uracil(1498)-N(3))-methyltransferase [Methanocella sp.]
MRIPRFFCGPSDRTGETISLPEAEARHAVRVLRLGPGARITVLDNSGLEHEAIIEEADSEDGRASVRARIVESRQRSTEPAPDFILLQGLPKGDKMDLIVEKATELGVQRIVPFLAERSVSRPDSQAGEKKAERWRRIALEAAKQAGRAVVPEVEAPQSLDTALASLPDGCWLLVPWEGERRRGLAEAVVAHNSEKSGEAGPVAVLIGPEGGLSQAEVGSAAAAGGVTVSLGPRILRTETAGLVALSCLLYATGNLE